MRALPFQKANCPSGSARWTSSLKWRVHSQSPSVRAAVAANAATEVSAKWSAASSCIVE